MKVAIDAGSCYVKVIEGCEKKGKLFIKKIGYFPNPFSSVRNDLVEREQDVFVKTLRIFLKKYGIGANTCVSSISGTGTIIHYFDIPVLPDSEIKSTVNLELMQVTPGGTRNLEYDYLLLPGKNKKNTVLFIGYPKDKCEFYINSLQRSRLKPLLIDHDSLAVLNAFRFLNPGRKKEPTFLFNVGNKNSNFALAEQGNGFVLIRDIPFGGRHITERIAHKKGISLDVAEIYKNKKENHEEVRNIISNDLEDLLGEVSTGVEYFKAKTGCFPPNIFLSGGGSLIPGISEAFQQYLKIDVQMWNPLEQIHKDIAFSEEIKELGTMFSVAIGLLLRQIQ